MDIATAAEKETLDTEVTAAQSGSVQAQQLALDASQLLTVTTKRFDEYKNSGFFKRCWYATNGKTAELQRATQSDLVMMQQFAWRYLSALQEQNLMQGQAIAVVRNNLSKLAMGEAETRRSVIKLVDKFDVRVKELEGHTAVHGWLLTVRASGYERYPVFHRVLKIAVDLFKIMQNRKISFQEIDVRKFLHTALTDLGVPQQAKVTPPQLMAALLAELSETEGDSELDFADILEIMVNSQVVSPSFILDNVSGCGYNTPYLLLERLKYVKEISAVATKEQHQLLNDWLFSVAPSPEAEYNLLELAEEVVAGSLLADAIYREQNSVSEKVSSNDDPANMELTYNQSSPVPKPGGDAKPKLGKLEQSAAVNSAYRGIPEDEVLSPALQAELLLFEDDSLLVALANNYALTEQTQTALAETGSTAVREALARNKCLVAKLQKYLYDTGTKNIKLQLAQNTSLIKELMLIFSKDEDDTVRTLLAANPSVDIECQCILIAHPDNDRSHGRNSLLTLLKNPSLADGLVHLMAQSKNAGHLTSLAGNPSLPLPLIERFCRYEHGANDEKAEDVFLPPSFGFTEAFKAVFLTRNYGGERSIKYAVAANASLPTPLQFELLGRWNTENSRQELLDSGAKARPVLEGLATNPSLHENIQARLLHITSMVFEATTPYEHWDSYAMDIQINLAKNLALKPAQQAVLAESEYEDVRLALADNPSITKPLKSKVFATFSTSDLHSAESRAKEHQAIAEKAEKKRRAAVNSHYRALGLDIPFFNSEERQNRLWQEQRDAQTNSYKASRRSDRSQSRVKKIKALLLIKSKADAV